MVVGSDESQCEAQFYRIVLYQCTNVGVGADVAREEVLDEIGIYRRWLQAKIFKESSEIWGGVEQCAIESLIVWR